MEIEEDEEIMRTPLRNVAMGGGDGGQDESGDWSGSAMGAGRGKVSAVEVGPVGLLAGRIGLVVKVKYSTSGWLRKVAVARGHVVNLGCVRSVVVGGRL